MTLVEKIDFKNRKVLIIGEASIDKYIVGSANRISPDAPVPNIKIDEDLSYIGGVGLALKFIKSFNTSSIGSSLIQSTSPSFVIFY